MIAWVVVIAVGRPPQIDLPNRTATPTPIALAVDALALLLSLSGWRNISRALAAPDLGQGQTRGGRMRAAVAGLLAFVVSLCVVLAVISPTVALSRGQAGWEDAAILAGTLHSIGC